MGLLHTFTFEKILKFYGAQRVSLEAAQAFAEVMEEILLDIAREAVSYTKHANRKTVLLEDIRLAAKNIIK